MPLRRCLGMRTRGGLGWRRVCGCQWTLIDVITVLCDMLCFLPCFLRYALVMSIRPYAALALYIERSYDCYLNKRIQYTLKRQSPTVRVTASRSRSFLVVRARTTRLDASRLAPQRLVGASILHVALNSNRINARDHHTKFADGFAD